MSFHTSIADELPKIKADFSFFLMAAMLFLMRDVRTASGIVIVCVLHELSHLAVMAVFGEKVKSIHFSGAGIRITADKSGTEPLLQTVLILLSGPAVNIILYFLLREKMPDTAAVLEILITGREHEYAFRTALRLLRIAITAVLAASLYPYIMDFTELLALHISQAVERIFVILF